MSLLGKEVRFTAQFLRDTGQHIGDWPLKRGTVVRELPLDGGNSLVTVDDAAFGEWKAHSANIELVKSTRNSVVDEDFSDDQLPRNIEDRIDVY